MDCTNITRLSNASSTEITDDTPAAQIALYVKYYIMDTAVPCVCFLGLVGNLLSLMVLTTEKLHRTLTKMETSAHIGLIALAVSDFLFCLLVFIFTQVYMKTYYEAGDSVIYFEFLANGLITLFIISSTWLIVVMAAERYIAVCHPLRARKLISLKRTRASIILVFVVCALVTIPIFLEKKIVEVLCDDGRSVYVLEERNQQSIKLRRILWSIFFDFIPCAALVYFNLCLIVQIRQAKKLRDRMTPKHTITLYSSGTKNSAHLMCPAHNNDYDYDCKNPYKQRLYIKQTRLNSSSTEVTGCKDIGQVNNGMREYSKYNVFYNARDKSSKSSCGSSSRSSDSDFKGLNDNRFRREPLSSSSRKTVISISSVSQRPSNSALNSVTATLVSVALLFLVLVSPSELMKFCVGYTSTDREYTQIVKYVTNFMQVLNFSLNFVLYCAVNKTFRHTLHGLVCCCWLTLRG